MEICIKEEKSLNNVWIRREEISQIKIFNQSLKKKGILHEL